jgi:hypothetical protein
VVQEAWNIDEAMVHDHILQQSEEVALKKKLRRVHACHVCGNV